MDHSTEHETFWASPLSASPEDAAAMATSTSSAAVSDNRALSAFALVVMAASATAIGSCAVFYPALADWATARILGASLGFACGVMLYVSLVDIYNKAIAGFVEQGHSEDNAFCYTTLAFFAGIGFMKFINWSIKRCTNRDEYEDESGMMEQLVARNQYQGSSKPQPWNGSEPQHQQQEEDDGEEVFLECQSHWPHHGTSADPMLHHKDLSSSSSASSFSGGGQEPPMKQHHHHHHHHGTMLPLVVSTGKASPIPMLSSTSALPPVSQVLELVENGFVTTTTTRTNPLESMVDCYPQAHDDNSRYFHNPNTTLNTTSSVTETITTIGGGGAGGRPPTPETASSLPSTTRQTVSPPPQQPPLPQTSGHHSSHHHRHHSGAPMPLEAAPPHPQGASGGPGRSKDLVSMGAATAMAIAMHNFPEGLVTFVTYIENPAVGVALAIGIAIHNIPEGLCVAMAIYYGTGDRWKGFVWGTLCCFSSEPLGALFAWLILRNSVFSGDTYGILYGMVAGMMVFICLDELLPMAFKFDARGTIVTWTCLAGMSLVAISLMLFKSAF